MSTHTIQASNQPPSFRLDMPLHELLTKPSTPRAELQCVGELNRFPDPVFPQRPELLGPIKRRSMEASSQAAMDARTDLSHDARMAVSLVADGIPGTKGLFVSKAAKERAALMDRRKHFRIGISRLLNTYTYAPLFNAYFEASVSKLKTSFTPTTPRRSCTARARAAARSIPAIPPRSASLTSTICSPPSTTRNH